MNLPVIWHMFGFQIYAHTILELAGYSLGFQLFRLTRKRWGLPPIPRADALLLLGGCILGAAMGSKLLAWIDRPTLYFGSVGNLPLLLEGKTIVGGLLGGWMGVEAVKKRIRLTVATGDAYVFPLILGMIVGRVGCFLTGPMDDTWGAATTGVFGIDPGDGVARYPLPLFEIVLLGVVGAGLWLRHRRAHSHGLLFRLFILFYMTYRFGVEFLKERDAVYLGLSGIQLAALVGATFALWSMFKHLNNQQYSNQYA